MTDVKKTEKMPVRRDTDTQALAWRISRCHEEGVTISMAAIGPHAINTAVKAVIIANGNMAPRGVVFDLFPRFSDAEGEEGITAVAFDVRPRSIGG